MTWIRLKSGRFITIAHDSIVGREKDAVESATVDEIVLSRRAYLTLLDQECFFHENTKYPFLEIGKEHFVFGSVNESAAFRKLLVDTYPKSDLYKTDRSYFFSAKKTLIGMGFLTLFFLIGMFLKRSWIISGGLGTSRSRTRPGLDDILILLTSIPKAWLISCFVSTLILAILNSTRLYKQGLNLIVVKLRR